MTMHPTLALLGAPRRREAVEALARHGPMTFGELADALRADPTGIRAALRPLQADGLVRDAGTSGPHEALLVELDAGRLREAAESLLGLVALAEQARTREP